jgi:hypothetical protein
MADPAMEIHHDFARRYAFVGLGDDVALRQKRWTGVLNAVNGAARARVESLLRLAYRTRAEADRSEVLAIRQAFREADEAFDMNGNDRELQVLAGACLVALMEDLSREEGSAAAIAATTASLGLGRQPDLPMNLASLGEAAIDRRGEENRRRPLLEDHVSVEPPRIDFSKAATKVTQQPDAAGFSEAFKLAADSASVAVRALAQQQARAISAANDFIRVQDEELQMLWWLTGQHSEEYDCAFNGVPSDAQPFVFASELANLTEFQPGPPSIKAILSRAGLSDRRRLAVTAAVNAPRTEWLRSLMRDVDPSPVSTPLHFAVQRQLETGAGEAWIPNWAASTEIDAAHALPKLTLAELFYRERLLLLFW